jgi:hypothetical protein
MSVPLSFEMLASNSYKEESVGLCWVQRRLPRPRLHPRPERRGFTRKPDNIERLLMK